MATPARAGYATIVGPGAPVKEFDTLTCAHCGRAWCVRTSSPSTTADPGGWCRLCMKPVCPTCAGKECVPFLRRLELYERRQDLFRSMGLSL